MALVLARALALFACLFGEPSGRAHIMSWLSSKKTDAPVVDANEREKIRAYGPKYRAFRDEVYATLRDFERAREWPDLIKALLKLRRTLDRYAQFPTIPHKLLFSKRLAQVRAFSLASPRTTLCFCALASSPF